MPKDRIEVLADGTVRPLARTGSSSTPLIVLGIVLLGGGATLVLVDRLRNGRARA